MGKLALSVAWWMHHCICYNEKKENVWSFFFAFYHSLALVQEFSLETRDVEGFQNMQRGHIREPHNEASGQEWGCNSLTLLPALFCGLWMTSVSGTLCVTDPHVTDTNSFTHLPCSTSLKRDTLVTNVCTCQLTHAFCVCVCVCIQSQLHMSEFVSVWVRVHYMRK